MLKATPHNLKKLETIYKESGYRVRYGKGNFQAGYCILDDQYQIVVNKFYSIEIKMGILTDLLTKVNLDVSNLSEGSLKAIAQQKVSLEEIGENRVKALAEKEAEETQVEEGAEVEESQVEEEAKPEAVVEEVEATVEQPEVDVVVEKPEVESVEEPKEIVEETLENEEAEAATTEKIIEKIEN